MLISDDRFFEEELDESFARLRGIGELYRREGLQAAEQRLAQVVRASVRAQEYLERIPKLGQTVVGGFDDDFAEAQEALQGSVISVGFRHRFPDGKIDWTCNPTDNQYAEWTWQLSRHPVWISLANCYLKTGDEKYAACYVDQLMSWIEQAPCPASADGHDTLCWRTIEAGIRLSYTWNYAFSAFYRSPFFTDHVLTCYLKSVWEHGYRLCGSYTRANWVVMEMSGLSQIGMFYPWLKKSAEWRKFAFGKMLDELQKQFYPDGFQYELSTGYQGIHVVEYAHLMDSARVLGYTVPDGLHERFAKIFEMYMKLCMPNWRTVALNDGDNADVAAQMQSGYHYFPDRKDFCWFATHGKDGTPPGYTSIALPYSGMAAMRTGWGEQDMFVFFESAPFGVAHQHEDKLHVTMFAYGHEVLKNIAFYNYDTSEMRRYVIDTRSHNCGMVDDCSQIRRRNKHWEEKDISRLSDLRYAFSDEVDTAEGVYDEGFGKEGVVAAAAPEAPIPVTHRRKVLFFKKGVGGSLPFAVVIDRMCAKDGRPHRLSIHYQMDKNGYTVNGKHFRMKFGDGVTMSLISSVVPAIVIGQKEPFWMGWQPKFAAGGIEPEHYPAPCVRYIADGCTSYRFGTVLYPSDNGEVMIGGIALSPDPNDTKFTLLFNDKSEITLDEADFPAAEVSDMQEG